MTRVEGPNLRLRLIEVSDAAHVHALRTNPVYNTHLSAVTGSVADQENRIKAHKSRDVPRQEYFFMIPTAR